MQSRATALDSDDRFWRRWHARAACTVARHQSPSRRAGDPAQHYRRTTVVATVALRHFVCSFAFHSTLISGWKLSHSLYIYSRYRYLGYPRLSKEMPNRIRLLYLDKTPFYPLAASRHSNQSASSATNMAAKLLPTTPNQPKCCQATPGSAAPRVPPR